MDTKLKNNRKKIIIVSFLMIVAISAVIVSGYPKMNERISSMVASKIYENESVLTEISKNNYMLLKNSMEYRMQKEMTIKELFFPTFKESSISAEVVGSHMESIFEQWGNYHKLSNLDYYIFDSQTKTYETNTKNDLKSLLSSEELDSKLLNIYGFYFSISYDSYGMMRVNNVYGSDFEKTVQFMKNSTLTKLLKNESTVFNDVLLTEEHPTNFTIVYGIPKQLKQGDAIGDAALMACYRGDAESSVILLSIGIMSVMLIVTIILGGKKVWYKENGLLARIPLEINAIVLLFIALFILDSGQIARSIILYRGLSFRSDMVNTFYKCSTFLKHMLLWIVLLGGIFITVSSLKQIFTMGPVSYLKKRTIIGYIMAKIKKFMLSLGEIDLTESSNKVIIKYILLHYVIMSIISSTWFIGILILIPYSFLLFFLLRKYFLKLKEKYASVLKVTRKMAEGNLDVEITEDLGVFEPLKKELEDIQIGFSKAVEEEVKSQKMKTELITNVSHDLKTPLTAIITYIDLLKGEQITEEERKSYIDTLERKSQRLKTLIEDLFEVSKADSRNVKLDMVDVDVIALMKQTQFELQETIMEHGLDFKWNVPDEKVILALDSQKTYRIFENLINNVVKYALPNSRVYINVYKQNQEIKIELKNISKEELNIGEEEITERFIRGDRARNTEGSGLGLSIVKSFVELQGGSFQIIIDGDLFKAVILFYQKNF